MTEVQSTVIPKVSTVSTQSTKVVEQPLTPSTPEEVAHSVMSLQQLAWSDDISTAKITENRLASQIASPHRLTM